MKTLQQKAQALGKAAFENGTAVAACQDELMMLMIQDGGRTTVALLTDWNIGYTKANLNAPVEV